MLEAAVDTPDSDDDNASKDAKLEVLGAEVLGGAKWSKLGVTSPVSCTSDSETNSDGRDLNVWPVAASQIARRFCSES